MTTRLLQMDFDFKIKWTEYACPLSLLGLVINISSIYYENYILVLITTEIDVQNRNESHTTVQYEENFLKLMSTHIWLHTDPNQKQYCSVCVKVSSKTYCFKR